MALRAPHQHLSPDYEDKACLGRGLACRTRGPGCKSGSDCRGGQSSRVRPTSSESAMAPRLGNPA